jgi:hypothetical protein
MREIFTKKVILVNVILVLLFFFLGYFLGKTNLDAHRETKTLQRKLLAWIDREYSLETGKKYYNNSYGFPTMIGTVPWPIDVFMSKFEKEFGDEFKSHFEFLEPDAFRNGNHLGDPASHLGVTWTELNLITSSKGNWTLIAVSPFGAKIVDKIGTNECGTNQESLLVIISAGIF